MEKDRILIADDSELNREMLTQMLGEEYDFAYAENGIEAIQILGGKQTINLVLLDLNMPKMGGFDVLRIMNEREWIEEFPVIIISAEDGTKFISEAYRLGAVDYISRPFRSILVQQRVKNTLLMYTKQKRLIQLVEKQVYEREKINSSMINILSNVIELRNHESGQHTLNVQIITNLLLHSLIRITDRYNLTNAEISLISSLAALHDIGKIKIPEEILNKPGKLTADEWVIMKMHTIYGDELLSSAKLDEVSEFVRVARSICRWHHEKYDGSGYPDGLKGDEIPIAAQVVSLADAYDALTSDRCYKKAFSHEKAMEMLLGGECGVYNPLLFECLKDISSSLKDYARRDAHYDYQSEAIAISSELLVENELPQDKALRQMLEAESRKKDFFMERCDGIQFEYDKQLRKATFVNLQERNSEKRKTVFASRDSDDNILPARYWDALRDKLIHTTRDEPTVEMDVLLRLGGEAFPYHAEMMAIWLEHGTEYISVLGHFTPLSDR